MQLNWTSSMFVSLETEEYIMMMKLTECTLLFRLYSLLIATLPGRQTACREDWLPWALSTERHGDAQGHTAGSSQVRSCLCCPHSLTRNSVPSQVDLVPLSFHLLSNPLIRRDMVLLYYGPPSIGLAAQSCIVLQTAPCSVYSTTF